MIWTAPLLWRFVELSGNERQSGRGLPHSKFVLWSARVVSAFLLLALAARANQITQYEPDNGVVNSNSVRISIDFINNDSGATYQSYNLYLLDHLSEAIYALPRNQTNYASKIDVRSHWGIQIRGAPDGEVSGGWVVSTGTIPTNVPSVITHAPFGYTVWKATQQDPLKDMMNVLVSIPISQLDGDGDGWSWYDPADFKIVLTTNLIANAGVAKDTAGQSRFATAQAYGVSPVGGAGPQALGAWEAGALGLWVWTTNIVSFAVDWSDAPAATAWHLLTNATPTNAAASTTLILDPAPTNAAKIYRIRM